ncbi:MAG TPA: hypothetical protein VGL18_04445 [Actinomycetota bacterium]|jgi:hypothetical protein
MADSSDVRRFAIRFSPWLLPLFWISGLGRRSSHVELTGDELHVRMGWGFRARIPRSSILRPRRGGNLWFSIGVHGGFGVWAVNGSARGTVWIDVEPPVRARVAGFPIRLRRLALGLEDPDGFMDALGAAQTA